MKRKGLETAVRIEENSPTALDEAHERQVEERMATLTERPEEFYKTTVLLKNGRSPRLPPL